MYVIEQEAVGVGSPTAHFCSPFAEYQIPRLASSDHGCKKAFLPFSRYAQPSYFYTRLFHDPTVRCSQRLGGPKN